MTKLVDHLLFGDRSRHLDGKARCCDGRVRGSRSARRHVAETRDRQSFANHPAWTANYEATKDLPAATGDDIMWADAVIFGSPTRFGSPAAQLRNFLDSLGGLWAEGKLADKVYAGFTSSNTLHGGQESTLRDPVR